MFKKPFNKKTGEDRICTHCGVTFHTMKPRNVCRPCVNLQNKLKRYADKGIVVGEDYKGHKGRSPDLEGIGYEERKKEWYKKSRWIEKNLNSREEWQEYFRSEFERISNDEKLWKSLTRDTLGQTPKREDEEVKMGRPSHKDTQWMTWEEYEANGWGIPEDD